MASLSAGRPLNDLTAALSAPGSYLDCLRPKKRSRSSLSAPHHARMRLCISISGTAAKQQPVEGQAVPGRAPSRALVRPLTRAPPGADGELGAAVNWSTDVNRRVDFPLALVGVGCGGGAQYGPKPSLLGLVWVGGSSGREECSASYAMVPSGRALRKPLTWRCFCIHRPAKPPVTGFARVVTALSRTSECGY